jgi:nucleotide-binding universal stress UspA family protein
MDDVAALPRPRKVFVLGHDATLDVEAVASRVVVEGAELVLVSLGHPAAPMQSVIVADALRLADELRLWLDAVLVTGPEQIRELLRDGDEVTILASGAERRRIARAVGRKVSGNGARPSRTSDAPARSHSARTDRALDGPPHVAPPVDRTSVALVAEAPAPERRAQNGEVSRPDEALSVPAASESVEALAGHEVVQPVLDTVWTREQAEARKNASLRVYLGAAPGVGKTFAMLSEGQRRRSRGTDVVVGMVQTYDRPRTIEMLQGLEVLPPRKIDYRGTTFEEMDTEALIGRHSDVGLIDELAHTNIPGSPRAKRWEDVMEVLAEGITVITTLNVQHLASVNDVVAEVTGIRQQETVPDWVLDLADDVELVDMSPKALQRRMMHGNVYPDPRKAELALRRFFTTDNLTALRELALMRVANRVDDALLAGWSKARAPETRERVLVCVSREDLSDALVRRGGRIAQGSRGDLLVVHVETGERHADEEWIHRVQQLVSDLGGEFQILEADDPVEAVLSFAYQQHVTQILVGESLRSRWQELLRGSFVNRLIQKASNVDVHVIARRER